MAEFVKGVEYKNIMERNDCTVVAEYVPERDRVAEYQSEADLEQDFIRRLGAQGYEYVTIHNEAELVKNRLFTVSRGKG